MVNAHLPRVLLLLIGLISAGAAQAQQYCLPAFYDGCAFDDNINSFTLSGNNSTSISDTGTHCSPGAYRDMSASMSVTLAQGGVYSAFINTDYSDESAEVFIDYNNDGAFSPSESVGGANWIDSAGVTFTVTVSPNAATGARRMRVVMSYDFTWPGIDACPDSANGYQYGEVHDYTVNIIPGSGGACDTAVNLAVTAITDTGAHLYWTAVPGAIGYEYVVSQSAALPAGAGMLTINPSVNAGSLTANTVYYLHVRTKCGPTTFSPWVSTMFVTNGSGRDWHYLRPDNTGLGGDYNAVVTGDPFGNIWLGGYMPTQGQGSVVRLNGAGVFTNWGTYDGFIPNGQVQAITFDRNDYLWVGTTAGIARYNGTAWTVYDGANSPLHMDGVNGMAVDGSNNVWAVVSRYNISFGTDLVHFNGTSWSLDTAGQPTQQLRNIAIDTAGNKWIASDIGLLKYNGATWQQFNSTNSSLTGSSAFRVQVDSLNRVWASSGGVLDIYDGTSWSHISNWPNATFQANFFHTRGNKLIVADYNSWEILIQNGNSWLTHTAPGWISDVYIDTNGHYWVAGQGFLSKYDGTAWRDYTRYNSGLSEYFNNDVFVDSKNRKWFANGNGGIQVFDCPKWEAYGPMNGGMYPSPQVMTTIGTSVTEDSHGDIWMTYDGTYGYAVQIPNGDYSNYGAWKYWNDTAVGVPGFQGIQKVVASTDGKVFMLTFWGEVFRYDHATNSWTKYSYGNGLHVVPQAIAAGLNGRVYVMGMGDMDEFHNGTWTHINLSTQAPSLTYIHDVAFDAANNMWLATNEGVWKYDSTAASWTQWNEANSNIAADYITSIEINKKTNQVFVGGYNFNTWPYYGGISVLNGNTWTSYLQGSSSIPHKQVTDLALDTLGNLWILPQSEGIAVYKQGGVAGFGCIDRTLQLRQQSPTAVAPVTLRREADFTVYPNPVSGTGTMAFDMVQGGTARIALYDLQGRAVRELYQGTLPKGKHEVSWNSTGLPAGVYMIRFTTAHNAAQRKIVVQ